MGDLLSLRAKCLACRKCPIGGVRINGHIANVFTKLNSTAKIMIVGQNPGFNEVEQGEPFVGRAGEIFNETIKRVLGIGRESLYVTNSTHCFSPGNRRPTEDEMDNCREFLDEEIRLVNPQVVLALGGVALSQLTGMSGITKRRGEVIPSLRYGKPIVATFHPSPLNMNQENRLLFEQDLKLLAKYL